MRLLYISAIVLILTISFPQPIHIEPLDKPKPVVVAKSTPVRPSPQTPQVSRGTQGPQPKEVLFNVSAYTANDEGMNGKGITASGVRAKRWHTVAASRGYPFGTKIYLPELGRTVVVEDRGGAIRGNKLDIYMDSRREALGFGRRMIVGHVYRTEVGSFEPNKNRVGH